MKFAELSNKKGFTDSLVGFFIGLMIVVIVAVSVVIPSVQTQISGLNTTNLDPNVVTLLKLVPLFIVLSIILLIVSLMRF